MWNYIAEELDFHHLDAQIKEHTVAGMVGKPLTAIAAEINKCVVLCANCHRRFHAGVLEIERLSPCHVSDDLSPLEGIR